MSATQIAKINAGRRALHNAKSVDGVKKVVALADGILAAARKLSDKSAQIEAAELRFRAMRRLGLMLEAQKNRFGLAKGGRPSKTGSKLNPVSRPVTFAELGINKRLAHEAHQLSWLSEVAFEAFISDWRKRSELANKRVTTTLLRPTSKDTKGKQTSLFDPSHSYLAWNGQKLERVQLKNASAPDWLKLAETTDSMVGMIATTVRKLNKIAVRIDDPMSVEKFQKAFGTLEADIEKLSDQYWSIRKFIAELESAGVTVRREPEPEPEYNAELERRGSWPSDAKKDDSDEWPL